MARILLIEDEDVLRSALGTLLREVGHTVEEAPNGKVGLDKFHATPPDLVITDLVMPVMEGLEVILLIKKKSPALKIIAMSGGGANPAGSYLRIAQKLGADFVLAKPFSQEELMATVEASLPPRQKPAFTFLVLDDHATSRFLNRGILETEFPSSSVIECGTIDEALVVSGGRKLDAVITDHHLGQTEGAEFVTQLRAQGATCPVLMVTNSSDPTVHARAYAAGAARVFAGNDTNFAGFLRNTLAT